MSQNGWSWVSKAKREAEWSQSVAVEDPFPDSKTNDLKVFLNLRQYVVLKLSGRHLRHMLVCILLFISLNPSFSPGTCWMRRKDFRHHREVDNKEEWVISLEAGMCCPCVEGWSCIRWGCRGPCLVQVRICERKAFWLRPYPAVAWILCRAVIACDHCISAPFKPCQCPPSLFMLFENILTFSLSLPPDSSL